MVEGDPSEAVVLIDILLGVLLVVSALLSMAARSQGSSHRR